MKLTDIVKPGDTIIVPERYFCHERPVEPRRPSRSRSCGWRRSGDRFSRGPAGRSRPARRPRCRSGDAAGRRRAPARLRARCSTSAAGRRSRRSCSCWSRVTVYTFTATPIYEARRAAADRGGEPERRHLQGSRSSRTRRRTTTTRRSTASCRAARWRGGRSTQLKLWDHPQFDPAREPRHQRRQRSSAPVAPGRRPGSRPPPRRRAARRRTRRRRSRRRSTRSCANLTVSPVRNSRLVDVKFALARCRRWRRRSPTRWRRAYIEQNLEFKFIVVEGSVATGSAQRLGEQRKQVEASEAALQRYREQNDADLARGARRTSSSRSWPT